MSGSGDTYTLTRKLRRAHTLVSPRAKFMHSELWNMHEIKTWAEKRLLHARRARSDLPRQQQPRCVCYYHGNLERALTFFYFAAPMRLPTFSFSCVRRRIAAAKKWVTWLAKRLNYAGDSILRRTQINRKNGFSLFRHFISNALQKVAPRPTHFKQNFAHFWCSNERNFYY